MEILPPIHLEEPPEGLFLATSDDLPGLLAPGLTVAEALEIAPDIACHLIEIYWEDGEELPPTPKVLSGSADLPIAMSRPAPGDNAVEF